MVRTRQWACVLTLAGVCSVGVRRLVLKRWVALEQAAAVLVATTLELHPPPPPAQRHSPSTPPGRTRSLRPQSPAGACPAPRRAAARCLTDVPEPAQEVLAAEATETVSRQLQAGCPKTRRRVKTRHPAAAALDRQPVELAARCTRL
jgi:hypothetical protein